MVERTGRNDDENVQRNEDSPPGSRIPEQAKPRTIPGRGNAFVSAELRSSVLGRGTAS